MNKVSIYEGDVLTVLRSLPGDSIHCAVTSPPYWGLRDYGVEGQIGLEPTIEEYVAKMVAVFREVRRVLRADGTLWLNLADSYAGSGGAGGDYNPGGLKAGQPKFPGKGSKGIRGGSPRHASQIFDGSYPTDQPNRYPLPGLKAKDLCMIPARVALALQSDGWWLRSDIIWAKPNPMPESCTDRPTTAHEHIFLLTKSARYFYDAEAVRETSVGQNHHDLTGCGYSAPGQTPQKGARGHGFQGRQGGSERVGPQSGGIGSKEWNPNPNGRNLRSVWTIATQPYPGAHFATFPTTIPERCIKAGTSEKGCCPKCGAPWVRVVEKGKAIARADNPNPVIPYDAQSGCTHGTGATTLHMERESVTTGWRPTCKCPHTEAELVPCMVLDPFFGSGTSGLVAAKMGRDCIGIELKPEYAQMAAKRIRKDLGMLATVEVIR